MRDAPVQQTTPTSLPKLDGVSISTGDIRTLLKNSAFGADIELSIYGRLASAQECQNVPSALIVQLAVVRRFATKSEQLCAPLSATPPDNKAELEVKDASQLKASIRARLIELVGWIDPIFAVTYHVANARLDDALRALPRCEQMCSREEASYAYHALGRAYFNDKNYRRASRFYQFAIHINPAATRSRTNLALSYAYENRLLEAEQIAKEVVSGWSVVPRDHYNYALVLHQMKKYQESEQNLRMAIALDPTYDLARILLAQSLIESGHLDEAGWHLMRAFVRKPTALTLFFVAKLMFKRFETTKDNQALASGRAILKGQIVAYRIREKLRGGDGCGKSSEAKALCDSSYFDGFDLNDACDEWNARRGLISDAKADPTDPDDRARDCRELDSLAAK